jgi:AraC-like DNA-binding protein/quercetin dioxygenase-like cupin family protein
MAALPQRFARNDVVHRTIGPVTYEGMVGAGFLTKTPARETSGWIRFPYYGALLLLEGEGTYVDHDGREEPLRPGDYLQRLPGRAHRSYVAEGARWAEGFVVFGMRFYRALVATGGVDPERPVLHPGPDLGLAAELEAIIADLRACAEDELPWMLARIHRWVAEIYHRDRAGATDDPVSEMVREACRLLDQDLQLRIRLPEMAARFHLSYERFRKVFREKTGLPPGEYRIRRRMERARELLLRKNTSVKRVAYALGYLDPFTFSRQFKHHSGLAPDAFRRMR